jgi:hypothetical protein
MVKSTDILGKTVASFRVEVTEGLFNTVKGKSPISL